ncbi:MAG: rRNA maturation RNase YbeY [Gammaproteobacteria bacterium]|nr:rRNA maturation RNase YbeY [Gammaproteobacteria bacterium]
MAIEIDVQYGEDLARQSCFLPSAEQITAWAEAALAGRREDGQLTVRIADEAEGAALNEAYRHKTGPTNVLSFPAGKDDFLPLPLLGDIVICAPVVEREAREQGKRAEAHWAHMVIHGVLHLLGYDHVEADEAQVMEALETEILGRLGFPDPYQENK